MSANVFAVNTDRDLCVTLLLLLQFYFTGLLSYNFSKPKLRHKLLVVNQCCL